MSAQMPQSQASLSVFQTDNALPEAAVSNPARTEPKTFPFASAVCRGLSGALVAVIAIVLMLPARAHAGNEALAHMTTQSTGVTMLALLALFIGMLALVGHSWSKAAASVRQNAGRQSKRIR
ncbi:MAG: hypothetical protein AAF739_03425 [Pseudomonadota bacterium]